MAIKLKLLAISLLITFVLCDDNLIIRTKSGKIRGKFMKIRSGKIIKAFLGIRYAEPPIGKLRFQPAVPKVKWEGIYDATHDYPMCPQINSYEFSTILEGEEDCLFLNVFTPKKSNGYSKNGSIPVMFWIHGGAYYLGSGNIDNYGPDFLMEKENIVLVSINYRLGALGFFSSGDNTIPGNNGLKDQILALKWVQENIKSFGGDPNKVTIFGESSGAASVHFLMLSSLSKGLFHAAISQSGAATCDWAYQSLEENTQLSKRLTYLLNCPIDDSKEMILCLQKVDVKNFMKVQSKLFDWYAYPTVTFRPVIEEKNSEAFIYNSPKDEIKSGRFSDIPFIIGVNSDEGLFKMLLFRLIPEALNEFDKNYEKISKTVLFGNRTIPNQLDLARKLKKFYFKGKGIKKSKLGNLIDLFSDAFFVNCFDETVNLMRKGGIKKIFVYLFGYKGDLTFSQISNPEREFGVSHGDELAYLFTMPYYNLSHKFITEEDAKMIEIMNIMWTNFANYMKPTPISAKLGHINWKPVQSDLIEYLYLGSHIKMEVKMFEERMKFLRKIRNEL